ncbi:hypothetical protein KKD19_02840 [Patescibacteria group bacterium]|nr:hypothetical protein [Patescibacteria group bacterium]MBU4512154.1 hypothetical protein [Patescibacteria group bacterium]MCG2693042.1 hypothetical protein [Candidatus Parcubacteria bacterium]
MGEREPKQPNFSESEFGKKQEEALEMDEKAREMVEKGEVKSKQEAVEMMEEKEMEEKTVEEMLKEALPLAWEEALRFAKREGFAVKEEIKKRIDLAKKYNLEVEHFFYDPEELNKEIPNQQEFVKTAEGLELVNEFAEEFSKHYKKPMFCIFNARNGTIFSYGMDTLSTQLNTQLEKITVKEEKSVQELRNEFARGLKENPHYKMNKNLALIETAKNWMNQGKIEYLSLGLKRFRVSSATADASSDYRHAFNPREEAVMKECVKMLEDDLCSVVFIDASAKFRQTLDFPHSFSAIDSEMARQGADRGFEFTELMEPGVEIKRSVKYAVNETDFRREKWGFLDVTSSKSMKTGKEWFQWFDNFPQLYGKFGKEFGHRDRVFELNKGGESSNERIIQSAQRIEYLSQKVKIALRYYQKDEEDRNWYERNFEGIMLGKKDAPEKGSKEYLEMLRKWVPYESDEKGEAKLDDKGYPIPRKEAPMTMAAEDELARVEAAMGELK